MAAKLILLWGDQELQTLWALPALRRLREQLPEAQLQLVAGKNTGEFLGQLRLIDEYLPLQVSEWSPWFFAQSNQQQLRQTAAFALLSEASLVINWLPDVMGVFARHWQAVPLARQNLLQAAPFEKRGEPAQVQLGHVLEQLALFAPAAWEPLIANQQRRALAASPSRLQHTSLSSSVPVSLFIEPCALQEHEHWPLKRWDALLRGYLATKPKQQQVWVSLPAGEVDSQRSQDLQALWEDLPLQWALGLSLLERGQLLQQTGLYWGQNTSTSQLALALEVPSLLLMGMEQAELRCWQPQGQGHFRCLEAAQGVIGRLSVAEAQAGLAKLIEMSLGR